MPSFEQALAELETIVHDLEDGKLGLAEALARYERGVNLLKQCYGLLEGAERRIEILCGVDADGNPISEPFEAAGELALEEKAQARSKRRTADRPPPSNQPSPGDSARPAQRPSPPGARGDDSDIDTPGSLF
ncbi:MAG: exodeoxyribonuclease VII small subunit [Planctomycetia bacterium]|nr:exodeoxyribonuclease VII small subunit [Planctomycetia bacterium]